MLQLHFPSGSLETSECAPIFADVLKRRLAAGLWLYIHIHIHTVCTYLREVQLVHKDCRNFFCLAHYRTLGRNLSNRENDQIQNQIRGRIGCISKVNAFGTRVKCCQHDVFRKRYENPFKSSWAPGCDIIRKRKQQARTSPPSPNLQRIWTRSAVGFEIRSFSGPSTHVGVLS